MFFERLQSLCDSQNIDISNALRNLNLSTSKGTAWKKGSIPSGTILLKLVAYFHVSTDYLLGATDDPTPAGGQKEKPASNEGSELSPAEKSLIQLFRLVPPESQEMVTQMIQAALKSQGLLP